MDGRKRLTAAEEDMLTEAARWLERARAGMSPAEKRAFRTWLDARNEHVAAADAIASSWAQAPQAAAQAGLTASPMPRRAPAMRPPPASGIGWIWRGAPLAAACATLALLAGGGWWVMNSQRLDYATGPGQRLALTLPDGSRAWLAPRTRVTARFDPLGRHISLHEGQATLQVAHREDKFSVDVGGVRILDRGTLFDVRKRGEEPMSVVLAEGSIEVRDLKTGKLLAVPAPGERVTVDGGRVAVARADAAAAIAWRSGRLVFNDWTLQSALSAFAEQGAPSVTLDGKGLEKLRISGVYSAQDIESFLSALAEIHPVRWHRTRQGYEVAPE